MKLNRMKFQCLKLDRRRGPLDDVDGGAPREVGVTKGEGMRNVLDVVTLFVRGELEDGR